MERKAVYAKLMIDTKLRVRVREKSSYSFIEPTLKVIILVIITSIILDYHYLRLSSREVPLKLDGQFVNHQISMNKCWHALRPEATSKERLRNVINERVKRSTQKMELAEPRELPARRSYV